MKNDEIKQIVKEEYGKIANQGSCCCNCDCNSTEINYEKLAKRIGYSDEDVQSVPDANLGLGCGNPTAIGHINEGDIVLDLGSGAGFDCFLASKKVGLSGKVIGIDMTEDMIKKSHLLKLMSFLR